MSSANPLFPRSFGVLLHPTSLPGAHGIGDLGAGARQWLDWLQAAGCSLWQVLPLVPPGAANSPYASASAMSCNTSLIDLYQLVHDGLLHDRELPHPQFGQQLDHTFVQTEKAKALDKAAERLRTQRNHPLYEACVAWSKQAPWVLDAALFSSVHAHFGDIPWWQWPADIRDRTPAALTQWGQALGPAVERYVALQFLFDRQWQQLRDYARQRGIRTLGDAPIYVDADSVDVWANRSLFQLDAHGRSRHVAGVPPDYFSELGQFWGNPLYDWAAMAQTGYRWWIARVRRCLQQTDLVRIDHFRGFSKYWAIPADAADARSGRWQPGPGKALFVALRSALGALPLVAEDLGDIDDDVHQLRDFADLPGMHVLQFAWGGNTDSPFLPHHHRPNAVVYTGTHDNDTTTGWWRANPQVHGQVRAYVRPQDPDIAWEFVRLACSSVANTAIAPLQDLLGLGSEARMNVPGVTDGNWGWRVPPGAFDRERAEKLLELIGMFDRLPRSR